MKLIKKPWGSEYIIFEGDYVMKEICINPGQRLSLQYHEVKHETIYVTEGKLTLVTEKLGGLNSQILEDEEYFVIDVGMKHRFENNTDKLVVLIEASTPHLDDVIRIEDDYERVVQF